MEKLHKILLVDDVPLFLELEQSFLRGFGAQVLTAADGTEAIEVARRERPDLIVMDLVMPTLNGDEACRRIKNDPEMGKTPVILVTAQGSEQVGDLRERSGCDAILFKPIRRGDLLDKINRLLQAGDGTPLAEARRVLVVEESRFYASLLQDVLSAKGYEVMTASTESELREQMAKQLPNLLLIDIILPCIDAFALLDRLRGRAEYSKVAVVALTSLSANDPVAEKARHYGVRDFISKTTPPADIGYRVDEILFARSANTRRSPRYTLRIPIEYKKGQFWILGEVANVSHTGLYVKALELPEMGARIQVRFEFPHQGPPCEEQAHVVWVQTPDALRPGGHGAVESGFGLRFVTPSKHFRKGFQEFLRKSGLS